MHGVGNCNVNGCLLLEFHVEQKMNITNATFQQKDSWKTTWMHLRSNTGTLLTKSWCVKETSVMFDTRKQCRVSY